MAHDKNIKLFKHEYHLTADRCNPQQEMPLGLLVADIIDIATRHANAWGVGYARLVADNQGWVLTRLSLEMKRMPRVNEHYVLSTWIEEYNRHFSQRHVEITGADGDILGYARTVWCVIDFTTRTGVDITKLEYISANALPQKPCPIAPQGRMAPFTPTRSSKYTFTYCDCDINCHVNTVRYVELLLNRFSLDFHRTHHVHRLDLTFVKECRYNDEATVVINDSDLNNTRIDIMVDGSAHVRAQFSFNSSSKVLEAP